MALVKSTNVSMSYATNKLNNIDESCFINKLPTSSQNTCSAAYSNRLVRAAYDGPIVQVRRGSDNALLDFYGDAYGVLTTRPFGAGQSLHTWLNGATGYVAKLYDQSGFEKHLSNPYIASNTSCPVSGLTGAVTNVSAAVGGGVYIVTSSGHDDFPPWQAFDNDLNSISRSTEYTYAVTTGLYTGTASTVTMGGTTYSGEWIQIQLPVGIKLSRFDLVPRGDYATTRSPRSFVLLGSTTGEAWNLVHEETNQNNWSSVSGNGVTKQFTVTSNPGAYKYYRLVVRRVGNFDNDTTFGTGNQISFSLADFKLWGGNTDTQPTIGTGIFPPMPMTANTTSVNDPTLTYGGGTYIASASTEFAGIYAAWKAFDYVDNVDYDSSWVSSETGGLIYNGTTGQYIGSVTTTVGATTYSGEWIQLQLPQRIQMTSFTICPRGTDSHLRSPRSFVILGSNNGTNWTLLHEQTNINDWANGVVKTFSVTPNSTSFSYFRMVTRRVGNFDSSSGQTSVNIFHWMLYGNNEACTDIVYNGSTNFLTTDYNIRSYPPLDLTGGSTTFTTAQYDNGTYIASASSTYASGTQGWTAFTTPINDGWHSEELAQYMYNTTTGQYTGTTTTTVGGRVYSGEWLQIQLPNPICLSSFTIVPRAGNETVRSPRSFVVLGSNNGSTWSLVHEETNVVTWAAVQAPKHFILSKAPPSSYNYYRIVVRRVGNSDSSSGQNSVQIMYWVLRSSQLPITQFESESFHSTFSMTSNDTTVAGLRYITSASSEHAAGPAWNAFDGDVGGTWWHSLGSWNGTTGQYTGSVVTRTTNGTSYSGEWLTIQLPYPIILNRYAILGRDGSTDRGPNNFVILGSNDGSNWNLVDQQTGIQWTSGISQNFYTRNNVNQYSYAYYRIIVSKVGNDNLSSGRDTVQIGVWQLFGFKTTQKTTVFMDTKSLGGTGTQVLFEQRAGPEIPNGSLGLASQVSGQVYYFGINNDSNLQSHISNYRRKMVLDIDHTITTNDMTFCDNGTFFKNNSGNSIAHSVGFGIFNVGAISSHHLYYFNGVINELIFFQESLRENDVLMYYQTANKKATTNYLNKPKTTVRGVLNIPNGQSLENETFPPAAMNASTNYLTSLIYGPGRYTASASSFATGQYPFAPYLAFDRVSSHNVYPVGYRTFWHSNGGYSTAGGYYNGAVSTAGHSGEWLQLDLAFPIVLKSFNLSARNDGDIGLQCPRSFVMLGSNDGTNWALLHTETNINNWNTTIGTTEVKTFTVTNFMSFRYYRLVVKRVGLSDSTVGGSVIIGELSLVGFSNTTMSHIPTGWKFAIDTQHLGNQSNNTPLRTWNTATAINSPTYFSLGGNQDFPYVQFNRASVQYLNGGSTAFNCVTNGGFTAVAFANFNNMTTNSFLFEISNGQANQALLCYVGGTSKQIIIDQYTGNNATYNAIATSNNVIVQGEWAVIAIRQNASTRLTEIYKNGVLLASSTFSIATQDATRSNVFVGQTAFGDGTPNLQLAGLYMYDKCLSLAEMAAIGNHLIMPVRKSISNLQDLSVVKANRAAIPIGRQLGEPSMFFDGSALNWVTVDDAPKAPFSFSFWFNASSSGSINNMALAALASYTKVGSASTHGIEIRYSAGTTITIYASLPTAWSTLTFTAARDAWHHLTITVSASNVLNAYLNGGGKQTINGAGAIPAASRFYIGSTGNDTGTNLKGYIQDFRVFDYVLRDDEVDATRGALAYRWSNYPILNSISSESGKYLVNRHNWYQKMTYTQNIGEYTAQQTGSDPDVQVQLANNTTNITNSYSQNFRIQDYRSFTCRFEIYNDNAGADAIYFFVGSHFSPLYQTTPYGGIMIVFDVYTDGGVKGVYVRNSYEQAVAYHPWTYWVNSGTDASVSNGTTVFMPVTITYTRGLVNTWTVCMGEREVLTYSDPNNDNWLTTSGDLWGIGSRTGGATMNSFIRGVELVYTEPRYAVPSYANTFYVNNIVQNGLVAHFDPAIPACYPGSGASLTSLVGSVTGTLGGTYSYNSNGTIRLSNTSANGSVNNSYLQLSSIANIRTVSIWYYQHSAPTNTYLLDGRSGNANAWIYNESIGSTWASGTLHKNGGSAQAIEWSNIETVGQWQNITVLSFGNISDDMTLFARYTLQQGLDVTFGPIFIYNRTITQAENAINYNAVLKTLPVFNQIPQNPLSLSSAVAGNKLVSFPNGHLYNNNVVQSGLAAYFDPANSACYNGNTASTSAGLRSLVGNVTGTLTGTFSYSNGTIRLSNTSGSASSNISTLQCSSITNITTVSLWYYQHASAASRGDGFLLDMRTGGANGFIYKDGAGSNWLSGTLYKNGGTAQSITWENIETVGVWQNITVIANTPATDDITLFAYYIVSHGMDVTFGPILIYNRAITQAENLQNYNALKDTIGSPYNASASSIYNLSGQTTYNAGKLFDKSNATSYISNGGYNNSSGVYTGAASTVAGGVTYSGEWVQTSLNNAIRLKSYTITPRVLNISIENPKFSTRTTLEADYQSTYSWNINLGWSASASSTLGSEDSGVNASKAFNKTTVDGNDCWHSALSTISASTPQWIQIKYPKPVSISSYSITSRNEPSVWFPTAFRLQGSNSGSSWVDLESNRSETTWSENTTKSYTPRFKTAYMYFRLTIEGARWQNGDASGDNTYVCIGEWRLYTNLLTSLYRSPRSFVVLGGNDGSSWNLIDERTGIINWYYGPKTFDVTRTPASYSYYRLVAREVGNSTNSPISNTTLDLAGWDLNAYSNTATIAPAINEYPPIGLSSTSASVSSQNYGNGVYISSASSVLNASTLANKAFNKTNVDGNDGWHSADGQPTISASNPQWLQILMPQAISINSYSITSRTATTYINYPTQWRLQGSNNGSTWVDLETNRSESTWTSNTIKTFSSNINTSNLSFVYFRLLIEASSRNGTGVEDNIWAAIGDWRLYGNERSTALTGTKYPIVPLNAEYPPYTSGTEALTTNLSGSAYGNGLYSYSFSSNYFHPNQGLFGNNGGSIWHGGGTANDLYNGTTGQYAGNKSTTDITGTVHSGEWAQVSLPDSIVLDKFILQSTTGNGDDQLRKSPRNFVVLGSNDNGSTWTLIHTVNNYTGWAGSEERTFTVSGNTLEFSTYRLVVKRIGTFDSGSGQDIVFIGQWRLFAKTIVPGSGVGCGEYIASASSNAGINELPSLAFNNNLTDFWTCGPGYYSNGVYQVNTTTTVDGVSRVGEWLQLQLPNPISLTSYSLYQNSIRGPKDFFVAGSNNGSTWELVDSETNVTGWTTAAKSFTTTNTKRFSYYRLIINSCNGDNYASITEWNLYDSTISMRSIAGNTTRGFVDGLTWKFANGYHGESATYFDTTPYTQIGRSSDFTNLSTATNGRFTTSQSSTAYSLEFTGYFKAPETGTYSFFANSDDAVYIWIGNSALSGYTTANALLSESWQDGSTYATITLVAGTYYPIKLLWGDGGGGRKLMFGFTTPSGVTVTDGSGYFFSSVGTNAAYPAESAKIIKALNGTNTDGVYYINVNGVSEPTYCLMNDRYDGGGWMMLMKATRGNTFVYDANYWTTANTLNATDVTRTDADAKYNAFNYKPIKDILAIWPDISPSTYTNNFGNQGGSFFVEDGWVWEITNWNGASAATALAGFQSSRTISPSAPAEFNGFGAMWTTQSGISAHVIGGGSHLASIQANKRVRWGFLWNNEADWASIDALGGIGMQHPTNGLLSAGDLCTHPGDGAFSNTGINRSARVEMFGR